LSSCFLAYYFAGALFGGEDTPFFHTLPAKSLAPEITKSYGIKGRAEALEITDWQDAAAITRWIDKAAK